MTPDERELRDFIVSYSIASFDPGKKGKNEDMTVIAKPDMESLRKDCSIKSSISSSKEL